MYSMNDIKTKIFWVCVAIIFCGSVIFSYWRFVIARDFIVVMHAECDPFTEYCFVERCDPQASTEDEWMCTGEDDEDVSYFMIQKRNASHIPECSSDDASCEPFACAPAEEECEVIYCDAAQDVVEDQECSDPQEYTATHSDEESVEEDDEELGAESVEEVNLSAPDAEVFEETTNEGNEVDVML